MPTRRHARLRPDNPRRGGFRLVLPEEDRNIELSPLDIDFKGLFYLDNYS